MAPVLNTTTAASRSAVLAAGLVIAGLALGRVDLVALAAPFVAGLVLGVAHLTRPRPAAPSAGSPAAQQAGQPPARALPAAALQVSAGLVREQDVIEAVITLGAETDLDAVAVSLAAPGFVPIGTCAQRVTAIRAGTRTTVRFRLRAEHWGRRQIGPVLVRAHGALLLSRDSGQLPAPPVPVAVLPVIEFFEAGEAVPRALAYAGTHRSRVAGPGVEFAGARPFGPGDRPRRINWRATLRTRELHVNATYTDRAAEVLVLIDSLHDAGPPGAAILDIAVRLAAGITEHYLAAGDAVGLIEYGGQNRLLRPAAGRRQLARARDWLLDVRTPLSAAVPLVAPSLTSLHTARALVITLTPLLDEQAAANLAVLRSRGAAVVGVDTLPAGTLPPADDLTAEIARRLWLVERRMLIARLGDLGIPVVRWGGPGSLDTVLADLARMAAAPRPVLR